MLIQQKDILDNEIDIPADIKVEVDFLSNCSIEKLIEKLNTYYPKDWDGSHPNLKHYIPVLNRIDTIFENHIKKYKLDRDSIAPLDVPYDEVQIIISCIQYSNQLLEYSTNRETYNSHAYIADLILSNSLDIKISALKLLCSLSEKFASHFPMKFSLPKRHRDMLIGFIKVFPLQSVRTTPGPTPIEINNFDQQTSSRSLSLVTDHITEQSSQSNKKQKKLKNDSSDIIHISLHDCMRPDFSIPNSWKSLNYEYYKTGAVISNNHGTKDSKKQKRKKDNSGEGLRTFKLSSEALKKLSLQQIFDKAVGVIPKERWIDFVLHVYISIAYSGKSFECLALRGKLVSFKCCSIALAVCNVTYSSFVGLVFDEEPYLLSYMCDLINPDNHIPREPCIATLRAFVNISNKKNGASDLMRALGGNVSHGLLFHILKTIFKQAKDGKFSNDQVYMNYLYNILANFLENKALATHLRSAGLMKILLDLLSLRNNYRMTRSGPLHLIEIFIEMLPEALDEFVANDGFNVIISLLQFEVDFAIQNPDYENGAPKNSNLSHIITARQVKLLNFLLKLVISLISNYPGDRMRNLYDSPLLGSIIKILKHPKIFGYELLFNSIRIITTIINNEPTAYSILKEASVIDTFLENFESFFLPDCDLILELPDAINAISLNVGGLAQTKENNVIPKLFTIFQNIEICKQLVVVENVMSLGHAIDELARHHPGLKDIINEQILKLINDIPGQVHFKALDFYQSQNGALYKNRSEPNIHNEPGALPLERWETSDDASTIQCTLIFLASIFENSKEWKRLFGQIDMNNLFKFVTLENAPFDYSLSKTIIHYRNIIKWIDQTTRSYCLPFLIEKLEETLVTLQDFINYPTASESYFIQFDNTKDDVLQRQARETLSNLGIMNSLLFVMSDFYSKLHKYQPNKILDIAEAFGSDSGLKLIRDLCKFYRRLTLEEVLLHVTTPTEVAQNAFTLVQSISIKQKEIGLPPPENDDWNGTSAKFKNISILYFNVSRSKFWLRNIFNSFCSINFGRRSENKTLFGAATRYAVGIVTEYTKTMMRMLKEIDTNNQEIRCGYYFCILNQLYLNQFHSLGPSASVNPTMSICLLQNENFPYLKDLTVEMFRILGTCDAKQIRDFSEKTYVSIELPSLVLAVLSQLLNIHADIGSVNIMSTVSNGDKLYAYLGEKSQDYVAEALASVQVQTAIACFVVLNEVLSEDCCNILNRIPEKLTDNLVEGIISVSKAAFTNFKSHHLKFKGRLYPISPEITTPSDYNVKFLTEAGASEEEAKEILIFFNDNVNILLNESVESLTENFELDGINWQAILDKKYVPPQIEPVHLDYSPKYDIDTIDDFNFNISTREQSFISQWILLAQLYPESVPSISNLVVSVFGKSFSENMNEVLDPLLEALNQMDFESSDEQQDKKLSATLYLIGLIFGKLSFSKYFSTIEKLVDLLCKHIKLENIDRIWFSSALMIFNKIFLETKAPYTPSTPKVEMASKFPPYLVSPPDIAVLDSSIDDFLLNIIFRIEKIRGEKLLLEIASLIIILCDTDEKIVLLSASSVVRALVLFVKDNKCSTIVHTQVIHVLRRSVESDDIVKTTLEKELNSIFIARRAAIGDKPEQKKLRIKDLKSFLEDNAALVFRKPQLLAEVIGEQCIIKPVNKHYKAPLITLLSDEDRKILLDHGINVDERKSYPSTNSANIMNFLLSELMHISRKDMMTNIPTENVSMEKKGKDQNSEEAINNNRSLAYAIFLLETVTELLFSYTSCKTEFLTFSKKPKNQADKKPRSTALNMLIHKFITVNSLEKEGDAIHNVHELLTSLGYACIIGLISTIPVHGVDYFSTKETDIDLCFARKFTVDILIKILKETESSKKNSIIKYGRVVDIINLVRKLCGEKIGNIVSLSLDEDITVNDKYHFTRELLDKKFVNVISGILARLDMNFPYTDQVTTAILKLYSLLGEIKVQYQEAFKLNHESVEGEEEVFDEDIEEKDEEEPDLLRNSTLGMYDLDDVEDEDEFDDDEFDDELLDDGIEIILSDHDEQGSDVEIINELDGDIEVEEINEDDDRIDSDVSISDGAEHENDFSRQVRDNQIDFVYESSDEDGSDEDMIDSHEIEDYVSGDEHEMSEDERYMIHGSTDSDTEGNDDDDSDIIELDLDTMDEDDDDLQDESDDSAILQEWLDEYENGEQNERIQSRSRRSSTVARQHQIMPSRLIFPATESGVPLPTEATLNDDSRTSFMEFTQALLDRRTNANVPQGLLDFRRMLEPMKSYRNHNFCSIKSTTQRWQEIAGLYVGTNVIYRIIPDIIKRVYKRSEVIINEQKRIKEEKEAKRREEKEEEKKVREKEQQREREQNEREQSQANGQDHDEFSIAEPTGPMYVDIGGRQVDISGTGIDQEFLLALPDEMRQEVYEQHLAQSRIEEGGRDAIDFFRNLNIRSGFIPESGDLSHIIRVPTGDDENDEDDEEGSEEENEDDDEGDDEAEIDSGAESVDLEDLEELQQIANSRNSMNMRSFFEHHLNGGIHMQRGNNVSNAIDVLTPKHGKSYKSYFVPLVDRPGIASLLKLLFVPQVYYKREIFFKTVAFLCLSKHTRAELIAMILYILQEGIKDQNSVASVYSQICSKAIAISKDANDSGSSIGEVSCPANCTTISLATQCIDVIQYLMENESSMRFHFVTEQDALSFMKKSSKKHKLKDTSYKFPINLLLNLLENGIIKEDTNLMDILSRSIQIATRPLPTMKAKLDELDKKETEQLKKLPQLPVIPDRSLKQIINILVANECANKVFHQTIVSIQNLSVLENARVVFPKELSKKATHLSSKIVKELKELISDLKNSRKEIEDLPALSQFSSGASDQAKLLRILTALDYLYQSKNNESDDIEELKTLYRNSALGPLWGALSNCLNMLREDDKMDYIAFILSPLIEALMVVCKHSKVQKMNSLDVLKYEEERVLDFTNEPIESLFFTFTEEHKKVFNHMIRNNPKLMSGPFAVLIRNPRVLEFDNKRVYFEFKLHDEGVTEAKEKIPINIRRDQVFLDSYRSIFFKPVEKVKKSTLEIKFNGEEGVDAGGVTREWYQVLSRQIFDPNYALFVPVESDKTTFHPNRTSWVNPEHLSFFKFVGMIIGKAIYDGYVLDCHFSRAVFKRLLGKPVSLKDMESLDLDYYKSLVWMLENDITDIIVETFSVETDDYGEHKIIDLVPNGRNVAVTEENKQEYVRLIVEYRLLTSVKDQMDNFLEGFYSIISKDLVSIFDEQELELLVSGLPDIDVDDWKNNTTYENYSPSSPQVQWFWRAVKSFDAEERAKLLQFATGTSKVPLNGFKELNGMNGVSKFSIHRVYNSTDRLPTAHTCFNQIDLPEYQSYTKLRNALLLAIREGHEGFGFA